jgi:hypothetical protein
MMHEFEILEPASAEGRNAVLRIFLAVQISPTI